MAGNKVNTKAKGKEDKTKPTNKSVVAGQTTEDTEDHDFALLRKPISTSVTGFGQARKIFDLATEELKNLLSNECDLLYECKVCRNIFRSLANFISHKRIYCKNNFNSTVHGHFIKRPSMLNEINIINKTEQEYQESLKEDDVEETMELDETDERIPLTKDLTAIVEKIAKKKGVPDYNSEESQLLLQRISNSSVAMFQNIDTGGEKQNDNIKTEVKEIDQMLSKNVAVLQEDGTFKVQSSPEADTENVIQISDDEENCNSDALKCKICDLHFSTQKTLKFHMKYKHVESRLVYPCPDCLEIFSTSWSVYRHLFKVHRKTAAQIRRLRESIQSKAFKMNNPPAFYEKRKNNLKVSAAAAQKVSEEERLEQETQAWMDNMEADGELPRCGGCGRTFERRAALSAHTHTCQPRSRALRRPEGRRIEIQIRKDYNKGPAPNVLPRDPTENKSTNKEESIARVRPKEDPKPPAEDQEEPSSADISEDEGKSESPEKSPEKGPENETRLKVEIVKPVGLPFAQHTEKSNLVALREKIHPIVDPERIVCRRCDADFASAELLYDHAAEHFQWRRYACKLCNFKSYHFDKLPQHVKEVHKLKGDKDFYFSTVKAITAAEALAMCPDDGPEPPTRRPSRASTDSSRLSDDSADPAHVDPAHSTGSAHSSNPAHSANPARKRKQSLPNHRTKKRKGSLLKALEDQKDDDSSNKDENDAYVRSFEETSTDLEEAEERGGQRPRETPPAPRRPVRRKTKPKNEDFEYDLSNLLKMEAQGYRDSQAMTSKSSQTKRKVQQETLTNYVGVNKDYAGALATLSKLAVQLSAAQMKTGTFPVLAPKERPASNALVKPKIALKLDKTSPRKEVSNNLKDNPILIKEIKKEVDLSTDSTEEPKNIDEEIKERDNEKETVKPPIETEPKSPVEDPIATESTRNSTEPVKQNIIPAVVPFKFRRQSLDVIKKNPLINKNFKDFSKAGLKTKILVIKPINRGKDGAQNPLNLNNPLKFQTIKLKDSSDDSADQVVVVKVPKVERAITIAKTDLNLIQELKADSETITLNALANHSSVPNEACQPTEVVAQNDSAPDVDAANHSSKAVHNKLENSESESIVDSENSDLDHSKSDSVSINSKSVGDSIEFIEVKSDSSNSFQSVNDDTADVKSTNENCLHTIESESADKICVNGDPKSSGNSIKSPESSKLAIDD